MNWLNCAVLSNRVPYYILDLLQQIPSVYVDGLGRFEAIFNSATIDLPKSKISPPNITPGFKDDQEAPNRMLEAYMLYVSGVKFGSPKEAIEEFVSKVHSHTEDGLSFEVEKFGVFSKNDQGNIRFTPDWDAFNVAFRGLETLDLQETVSIPTPAPAYVPPPPVYTPTPVAIVEEASGTTTDADDQKEETETSDLHKATAEYEKQLEHIDDSTSRLWWIILSSALVLIAVLCAYLAWDIMSNRNRLNDLKQIYPDTITSTRIGEDPTPDKPVVTTEPAITTPTEPAVNQTPVQEVKPNETDTPCYIIVGAFSDPANVARMVEQVTGLGYTAEEMQGRQLTKVAIRTSCDPASLQKTLTDVKATIHPEAWIY